MVDKSGLFVLSAEVQKSNQMRSITEERQRMRADRIAVAPEYKGAGRYGEILREVRDGGRCRSAAFLFDWVIVDPCFSE